MEIGYYTSNVNSDLFIRVYKVHHISERTGMIRLRATVYYKSDNDICHYITPFEAKNLILIYSVVKGWVKYDVK